MNERFERRFYGVLCFVWAAVMCFPILAQAETSSFQFGNNTEAFFLAGLTGGGSFGTPGGGGYVGGEMSLAWLKEGLWGGFYGDAAYDFGHGAATFTLGPELGFAVFGLDGGVGLRLGREDEPELGYQARGLITFGNFAIYGRYGLWPGSVDAKHVGQVGVTLKFALWNSYDDRPLAP